jgi:hypothetical protein
MKIFLLLVKKPQVADNRIIGKSSYYKRGFYGKNNRFMVTGCSNFYYYSIEIIWNYINLSYLNLVVCVNKLLAYARSVLFFFVQIPL